MFHGRVRREFWLPFCTNHMVLMGPPAHGHRKWLVVYTPNDCKYFLKCEIQEEQRTCGGRHTINVRDSFFSRPVPFTNKKLTQFSAAGFCYFIVSFIQLSLFTMLNTLSIIIIKFLSYIYWPGIPKILHFGYVCIAFYAVSWRRKDRKISFRPFS